MKIFAYKGEKGAAQSLAFRLNPVAAGCAVLLSAMATQAMAQEAAPAPQTEAAAAQPATPAAQAAPSSPETAPGVQQVQVTGIRRGIEAAISVKKNSTSIVEAISAEDIGKLPDSSIAESIARLPGLTAQRVAGRAQNISIRGMSGDFSTALLNGREQVSTGDNRSVEFDQYPSELLAGVVIYKTPDAALVGQGLSGTVDLQTVRPLAFGKRTIAANVRKEKSGVGTEFKGDGKRYNLSYIDQFANRTIGVALGFARLESDVSTARAENYDTSTDFTYNGTPIKVVNGFKLFNDTTTQKRDGVMGVLEFRPNKELWTMLDLYYSKFDKDVVKRGLEIQVNDSWKAGNSTPHIAAQAPVLQPGATISNGKLVAGTWENVNPLSRHIWEPREDELKSAGWNTKFKFADRWTAIADLSYSEAVRQEKITELEAGAATPERVTVTNSNQIAALQFDHGNPAIIKLTDPESWGQNGYDKDISTKDKIEALRLGAERELDGVFSKVSFGVNYTDRNKVKSAIENKLILKTPLTSLPSGTTGVNVGGSNFQSVAFHPSEVYPSAYNLQPNYYADIFLKSWIVSEEATTGYLKGELDTEVGGFGLRGNVGVQVVRTNQSSTAPQVDLSNQNIATNVTLGKSYTDVLPSANLVLDLGGDQTLRFGVAKVMARARMDQMSAGRRSSIDKGKWTGSGGNPYLDPFRANAFDLSYEKYWGQKAYVSAAVFYKDLKSYIFDFTDKNYNFTGFPNLSGNAATSVVGEFTQPRNGQGGSIKGVELAASVPLGQLTDVLDGFGLVGSYANTSSEISPFGAADKRPLPGLSKRVSSLAVYYEKHGFSARVAQRTRSDFLGEVTGFGASREYTYIKGERIIDVQLGYEFQGGPAKGLSFLLQVNNANDAVYQRFQDTPDNIIDTIKYGKTILFGVNYKF